jgi:hypothetical protein
MTVDVQSAIVINRPVSEVSGTLLIRISRRSGTSI